MSIFATGLGPITPALADGTVTQLPLPQNQIPVDASSGSGSSSTPWSVEYYGPAPLEIAGQVNLRVPSLSTDSPVQTVYLQVGDEVSAFSIYAAKP